MNRSSDRRRFVLVCLLLSFGMLIAAGVGWAFGGFRSLAFHLPFWTSAVGVGAVVLWGRDQLADLFTGRAAAHGAAAVFSAAAAVGIAAMLNAIAASRFDIHWDSTEDKVFTLSEQTHAVLDSLTENAEIVGFFPSDPEATRYNDGLYAEHLLTLYRRASDGKIDFEMVDPYLSPRRAQEYGILHEGVAAFKMAGRIERTSSLTEADFTAALLKLSRGETPAVYFLINHGERSLADPNETGYTSVEVGLMKQNYSVEPLDLRRAPVRVPADAAAVVIAGPREPFLASELNALDQYVDRGGRVMALLDPINEDKLENLRTWLKKRSGADIQNAAVIDSRYNYSADPFFMSAQLEPHHQITATLHQSIRSVPFPLASPVVFEANVDYAPLASSGSEAPQSWIENDLATAPPAYEPGKGDVGGPVLMAAAVEGKGENGARFALFGDSDFASNQLYAYGGDLFLYTVNWLTRQEDLIAIPPRDPTQRVLRRLGSQGERVAFVAIAVFLAPALFSIVGIAVWLWRR